MCFSAAGCNSADAVTATDADDCCINKDDGLYYFDGTNCMECISKWLIKYIASVYPVLLHVYLARSCYKCKS